MKPVDIQINQAKIMSYDVTLQDDGVPTVTARIGLFSGEKKITSFSLTTQTYYSEGMTFELPASMINPIVDISKQLEVILVRECNKQLKRLPMPTVEAEKVEE